MVDLRSPEVPESLSLDVGRPMVLGRMTDIPWLSRLFIRYPDVGKRHATVTAVDRQYVAVKDLDSTNGTFIEGIRLPKGGERTVHLPVTIRLASACQLTLTAAL